MLLDRLLANESNKAALIRLCEAGRLPHAVVLEGPRGCGRFLLARCIAAMGVCRADPPGCGVCADCRLALEEKHPDVEVFARSGAPGNLTIKSLRTINQSVATPPVQGRRRVVILRDLQDAAQIRTLNALLKVMEEPPDYLMFVFTVDNRENLLPTILSRCTLMRMQLPSVADGAREAARLLAGAADEATVLRIAELCGGNIGRTVALLGESGGAAVMHDALALTKTLLDADCYALLRALRAYERDRARCRELIDCLYEIFGRITRAKYAPDGPFAEQAARITARQGLAVLEVLGRARDEGRCNVNLPLALTRLGFQLHAAVMNGAGAPGSGF